MQKVKLIGLKRFPYAGHAIQKDEPFEATVRDARVLVTMGRARQDLTIAPQPAVIQAPPASVAAQAPRRRQYRRRDMTAE